MTRWPALRRVQQIIARPSITICDEGHFCQSSLNDAVERTPKPKLERCDVPDGVYNSSNADLFYNHLTNSKTEWKTINFVACHGNFIRQFARLVLAKRGDTTEADERILSQLHRLRKNNLFIVKVDLPLSDQTSRRIYMIRHCARQFQKSPGLIGFLKEHTTPDPKCARVDDKICHEDEFKKSIAQILEQEKRERDTSDVSVGVYSSCMNRANETARIVAIATNTRENEIRVLPYCREHTNLLGVVGLDVLNVCSNDTMKRLRRHTECSSR